MLYIGVRSISCRRHPSLLAKMVPKPYPGLRSLCCRRASSGPYAPPGRHAVGLSLKRPPPGVLHRTSSRACLELEYHGLRNENPGGPSCLDHLLAPYLGESGFKKGFSGLPNAWLLEYCLHRLEIASGDSEDSGHRSCQGLC